MIEAQIYYPRHILYLASYMGELALQALIIVQTIIHHHSKVCVSGQARVNPEHYVIKCVGGR